jgi:hypothetical protein
MKKYCVHTCAALVICIGILLSVRAEDNCFLEDWEPKTARIPPYQEAVKTTSAPTVVVTINASDTLGKVSKYLYGNNANLWMSQMVTETALLDHINLLGPNIIRFPGGNVTNVFFWNAAVNQPLVDVPDSLYNDQGKKVRAGYWYGKNADSWTLSLDNYYQMLEMTDNTGIICVNFSYSRYGTGPNPAATAAHYAAEWVRYDDGLTRFWEIGNEDFGPWQAGYKIDTKRNQDGQPEIITGTIYGKHFKVFADSMRKAAQEIGSTIYIGAQLIEDPVGNSWIPPARTWNKDFFSQAGNAADFFIVHNYFTNYNENSSTAVILNSAPTRTTDIMNYMNQTTSENQALLKPIALTEWNIFAVGSKQSCSFISGMHAASVLGELARNGYSMAARWDLANGYDNGNDHGMFNNGDEPGVPKWNPRPAFFYMYYFQKFYGDHAMNSTVTGNGDVVAYASTFGSGEMGVVVVNKGGAEQIVKLEPVNHGCGERYFIYSLTGGNDNGDFSQVVYVNDNAPDYASGGPIENFEDAEAYAYPIGDVVKFISTGRSVQFILIEAGNNIISNVEDRSNASGKFGLISNSPNPFNPLTTIHYSLKKKENVTLHVHNISGQRVRTLIEDQRQPAGEYHVDWDGRDDQGCLISNGVYFCKIQVGGFSQTQKMILEK